MENNKFTNDREEFERVIDNSLDLITLIDDIGNVLYSSPAFLNRFGYDLPEKGKSNIFSMIHKEDVERFKKSFVSMLSNNSVYGIPMAEFRLQSNGESWRHIDAVISNLLEYEGVKAVLVNYRDVTEYKESLIELEKYQSQLEELVEQRTRELTDSLEKEKIVIEQQRNFIAMVSHEFRTPLTIIDGNAQIIQSRGNTLDQEILQRRSLTIRKAVERLVGLIERVLSGKVMESGDLKIDISPCDFAAMVRSICIEKLGITPEAKIKLDIQRDIPEIMIDEKLVHQLVLNLISNAFKYSGEEPEIKVKIYAENDNVFLMVSDNGVGIPADEIQKIFTKYFRASTSAGIPGTGLGMNLVKEIAELHNGTASIESEVDIGTTVTVRLPMNLPREIGKKE